MLLDIGANPDSTPENLAQYARMGAIFAERVLGVRDPRVALLSIGEEKGKGDHASSARRSCSTRPTSSFIGNVEGKDLTTHMADVVVCDAVLGNVVIKFFEGLSTFIFDLWRGEFSGRSRGPIAYVLMRPGIARIRARLRLRAARRVAAAGRQGHGHHHARPREAADDRVRRARGQMARERVPELIAEALREDAATSPSRLSRRTPIRPVPSRPTRPSSRPALCAS